MPVLVPVLLLVLELGPVAVPVVEIPWAIPAGRWPVPMEEPPAPLAIPLLLPLLGREARKNRPATKPTVTAEAMKTIGQRRAISSASAARSRHDELRMRSAKSPICSAASSA